MVEKEEAARSRKTWRSTFCDDLHAREVTWNETQELAADRVQCTLAKPAAHCPEKGLEELSAEC